MSLYKLLIADIDGTVVDHNSDGSEIGVEHPSKIAIDEIIKRDKIVTFATGRNYEWAKPVINAFQITNPVIVNSGSRIVDPTSDIVLWEQRLSVENAQQIFTYIIEHKLNQQFQVGFGHRQEVAFADITKSLLQDIIYLDLIGVRSDEDIAKIVALIEKMHDASVSVVLSPQSPGNKNIIVTNSNGTKYHGVRQLQKMLNISHAETIAVGDGGNDAPLFEASGLKIAVDNASPALKELADVIVKSVHEHGIADVINNYLK